MAAPSTKRRTVRTTPKTKARASSKRAASAKTSAPTSKIEQVIAALRAPKGATISASMDLTGWQAHSVRGAIAGTLKKSRGLSVVSEKSGDERFYRIAGKP